jgi:hypothetical protein
MPLLLLGDKAWVWVSVIVHHKNRYSLPGFEPHTSGFVDWTKRKKKKKVKTRPTPVLCQSSFHLSHPSLSYAVLHSRFIGLFVSILPYSSDGRSGVVVGILAYYARGHRFDFRTVQTFVCTNMSVCIGSGCLCKTCIYKKKYVFILYIESITQAYMRNLMTVEAAKDVRIVASGRKWSLPTPKGNGRDIILFFLLTQALWVLTLESTHKACVDKPYECLLWTR